MTMSSGFPIGRNFVSPERTGSFGGGFAGNRSNLVGDPCLSTSRSRGDEIAQWVNPSAFDFPEPFAFGTTPRNMPGCRIDGIKNFDITIIKHIPIKESVRAEFRAEFFTFARRFGRGPISRKRIGTWAWSLVRLGKRRSPSRRFVKRRDSSPIGPKPIIHWPSRL